MCAVLKVFINGKAVLTSFLGTVAPPVENALWETCFSFMSKWSAKQNIDIGGHHLKVVDQIHPHVLLQVSLDQTNDVGIEVIFGQNSLIAPPSGQHSSLLVPE